MITLLSRDIALCLALPIVCFAGYWFDRPFSHELTSVRIPLTDLSVQQKLNIQAAAGRLNATVMRPGEEFSFNRTGGPRTLRRGYLEAPSYVGKDAPPTIGGGICVVSSALYQDALRAGLPVTERTAHLRTIGSALPGLDATVWYGQSDLRFADSLDCPIEIATAYTPSDLTVTLLGNTHIKDWAPAKINRSVRQIAHDQISVQVMTSQFNKAKLVSSDVYGITNAGAHTR